MSAPPGLARRLARDTVYAATGRFASLAVWLLLMPAVLRRLGPEGFGIWSLFFALTGYLNALDLGLAQGALRQVASARERGEPGWGGGAATVAGAGYLALAGAWALLAAAAGGPLLDLLRVPEPLRDDGRFVLFAGAVVFALSGLANIGVAVLQAVGRFDLGNLATIVTAAATGLAAAGALAAGAGLRGIVAATAAGWLAGAVTAAALIRSAAPGFRAWPAADLRGTLREAIRFGAPLQAANTLNVAHTQLDKFLLARYVSLGGVTPFELGLRVVTAASAIPQMLVLAVLPAAAGLHAGGQDARLRELYERGNRWVLAATAVMLAGLLAGADRLFLAWLGPGHDEAALALRGLAGTAALSLAVGMGVAVARGIGRTDLEAGFGGLTFASHLALSLWWVPSQGLRGALAAMFAATALGAIVFLARLGRVTGWRGGALAAAPFGRPLLAAAIGTALGWGADRLLPGAAGAAAWATTAATGGVAAAGAFATLLALRYVGIGELRRLLPGAPAGP